MIVITKEGETKTELVCEQCDDVREMGLDKC
jgi:hypothetical protein